MSAIETHSEAGQGSQARLKRKRPRSAVTSGRRQFVTGNPNGAWARRFYDLISGHIQDAGGRDVISEAQLALIKRAAGLECALEEMEGRLSQGVEVDLDRYGRAASHLRRLLESLGIERKPRTIAPPSPLDYAKFLDEAPP
jgi:hypothetical protein